MPVTMRLIREHEQDRISDTNALAKKDGQSK